MRRTVALLALLLCTAQASSKQPMVLLAVWTSNRTMPDGSHQTSTYVEPIAFMTLAPYTSKREVRFQEWPDPEWRRRTPRVFPAQAFIDRYYRVGTAYRLFRGGVPDGLVTIRPSDHNTCDEVRRRAEETSTTAVDAAWNGASGVAVGSFVMPQHRQPRRAPTAAEETDLQALAKRAFGLKAVAPEALEHLKEWNAVAADLDGDGHSDLVGSFEATDSEWQHRLFILAVWDRSGQYRADVVWYNRYPQKQDSITAARSWSLVDYEDFDGDGIDEVIVAQHGWESTRYKILKLHHEGAWDVVYGGGGSGC